MISSAHVAACAFVLLAGATAASRAAEDPAERKREAQAKMEEGGQLFARGDHQGALAKFNEARALFPSPKIYFNMGQALRKLERLPAAVDAFERFLAEATDAAPNARRDARGIIEELKPRIGYVCIKADAGLEVALDGQAIGVAPIPRPLPVDPGRHEIALRWPGAALVDVRSVDVAAGASVDCQRPALAVAPPPAMKPAPPTMGPSAAVAQPRAPDRAAGAPWWLWVTAGGLLVGAGLAAALITRDGPLPTGSLGAYDARP